MPAEAVQPEAGLLLLFLEGSRTHAGQTLQAFHVSEAPLARCRRLERTFVVTCNDFGR